MMRRNGIRVEDIRATAYRLAFGVQPDMTEYGSDRDDCSRASIACSPP
ncbi:MAG: hypothetical protein AB7M05_20275 [Alphaproteobacteria bacterium]